MPKENKFATIKEGGSKKMRVKRVVYAKLLIEADDNRTLVFGSQSKLLLEGDNIPAETAERLAREVADGRQGALRTHDAIRHPGLEADVVDHPPGSVACALAVREG
jgi:hypothetical protein